MLHLVFHECQLPGKSLMRYMLSFFVLFKEELSFYLIKSLKNLLALTFVIKNNVALAEQFS